MVPFLLACLRSNISGGGGGGPFDLVSVNLSRNQNGTSCGNPYKVNVSVSYTGSVSGITLNLEKSWDGGAFEVVEYNLPPTSFPYVLSVQGYYNKFGTYVGLRCRVSVVGDAANVAVSSPHINTYNRCDL